MKFGKILSQTAEQFPEMETLFLRYKQLKKQLKQMKVPEPGGDGGVAHSVAERGEQAGTGSSGEPVSCHRGRTWYLRKRYISPKSALQCGGVRLTCGAEHE
jgi:hypothetical protein